MKHGILYIVLNEGEVEYASPNKSAAQLYANNSFLSARDAILEEWGIDDPVDKDLDEASFQAGFDGGCYEVEKVDLTNLNYDDTVEISDGSEIDVSDILEKLQEDDELF